MPTTKRIVRRRTVKVPVKKASKVPTPFAWSEAKLTATSQHGKNQVVVMYKEAPAFVPGSLLVLRRDG